MTEAALKPGTKSIIVEEVLPHAPELIWRTLTTGPLMARWLKMPPSGFSTEPGTQFTYQTTPAGGWDGVIHCTVLESIPNERLVYAWKGGHESNAGYGAPLDTVVTFTLTPEAGGTRLRLVHAGFVLPRNDSAYSGMSNGWKGVVTRIGELSGE